MQDLNSAFMNAVSGILPYEVKYEGKLFTPPSDKPWMELKHIPTTNQPLQTVEKQGGILQIDINHPLDTGAPKILADADKVKAKLKPYSRFEYNGQSFTIKKVDYSQILNKENYNVIHLSVYYMAITNI